MGPADRRLCFVVQRYGREVAGGAETLCRQVAERLAAHYRITVLTTCAQDYLTWKNHYPPGESADAGVTVIRFPAVRERKVRSFGRFSVKLYSRPHSLSDEMLWMERQGPDAPSLLGYLEDHRRDFDLFLFFTYLYPPTFFGLPLVASRALLVPMAHPEDPLKLGIFRYLFSLPRGFIFNTAEERDLVFSRFDCGHIPHDVAGMGIDLPREQDRGGAGPPTLPYLLYAGRLDVQKGLDELFDFFRRYREARPRKPVKLLLAGERKMKLPRHPDISHLGFLPGPDKEAAMAGARAVVVPSPHESLSIVALEAWSLGRPVLANGRSAVLEGQCRRSGGGLTYADYTGFESAVDTLMEDPVRSAELGRRGREFVAREYTWESIERKYRTFIDASLERTAAG